MTPVAPQVRPRRLIDDVWYEVREYDILFGDSEAGPALTRVSCRRGDRVGVLPYSFTDRQIVLVSQFRLPVYLGSPESDGRTLEIPGGLVEGDVTASARREVAEETGVRVDQLISIGTVFCCPTLVAERTCLFLAPVEAREIASAGRGGGDDEERTEVSVWSLDDALSAVAAGDITDAKTALAITRLAIQNRQMPWGSAGLADSRKRRPQHRAD